MKNIVLLEKEHSALKRDYKLLSDKYTRLEDSYKLCKDANETIKATAVRLDKNITYIINYIDTEIRNYISDSDLSAFERDLQHLKTYGRLDNKRR